MPLLPREPSRRGDILTWALGVQRYLRALTPSGDGVAFTDAGTTHRWPETRPGAPGAPPAARPPARPFQLLAGTNGATPPSPRLLVRPSTLAGSLPEEPDTNAQGAYVFVPQVGVRYIYGRVTFDVETGEVTERQLVQNASNSLASTTTGETRHVLIGTYEFGPPPGGGANVFKSITNYGYGPIDGNVCRAWFAEPPNLYTLTFTLK